MRLRVDRQFVLRLAQRWLCFGLILIACAGCQGHGTASCSAQTPDDLPDLLAGIKPVDGVHLDQWRATRYGEEPPVILTRTSIYQAPGLVIFRTCELIRFEEANIYVDVFTPSGEFVERRVWFGEEDGEGEWFMRSFPEQENWIILANRERRVRPFKAPVDAMHESWLPLLIRYHQRRGTERFKVDLARNYGVSDSAERITANRLGAEPINPDHPERSVDVWVVDTQYIDGNSESQRTAEYWYVLQAGSLLETVGPGKESSTTVTVDNLPESLVPPELFFDLKAIGGDLPKP